MRTNLVFAALVSMLVVLSGGCAPDAKAPPIFRTSEEYLAKLKEVDELTQSSFKAVHEGFPVSEEEKTKLRKADKIIDGLIAYNARNYGPYILKGLTQRALGNNEQALRAYQQGLSMVPSELTSDDMAAVARIHDELVSYYFDQKDFKQAELHADQAIKLLPDDPSLLTNAAGVKIQLNKIPEASALLERALKQDPHYKMALDLQKLIKPQTK